MTQPKHTPEPQWKVILDIPDPMYGLMHQVKLDNLAQTPIATLWVGGGTDGKRLQKLRAKRIVSCVNFLSGMEDLSDKVVVSKEFVEAARELYLALLKYDRSGTYEKGKFCSCMAGFGGKEPDVYHNESCLTSRQSLTRAEKAFGGLK